MARAVGIENDNMAVGIIEWRIVVSSIPDDDVCFRSAWARMLP